MIPLRLLFRDSEGNDCWLIVFIPNAWANFELEDVFHDCFEGFPTTTTKRESTAKSKRKVGGIKHDELASIYKQIDNLESFL